MSTSVCTPRDRKLSEQKTKLVKYNTNTSIVLTLVKFIRHCQMGVIVTYPALSLFICHCRVISHCITMIHYGYTEILFSFDIFNLYINLSWGGMQIKHYYKHVFLILNNPYITFLTLPSCINTHKWKIDNFQY